MALSRKSIAYLLPLAVFLGIAGFLLKGLWLDPREIPSPLINKQAPDFRLESLGAPGTFVAPKDMLGKVWLLNFWGSWCVACREEHPLLVEFSRTGVAPVVGVDYKEDDRTAGQRWLRQLGDPFAACGFDPLGRVSIDYGVYAAPETFLIDKQGVIRYKQIGPVTPDILREKIVPMIQRLNA
jgi:cytochrome c biogenesis protein CcmG, thiol:disulfide interchange protein DsbE